MRLGVVIRLDNYFHLQIDCADGSTAEYFVVEDETNYKIKIPATLAQILIDCSDELLFMGIEK